ncbi:MAG TPA: hypothetical protein ENK18_19035 [Deltaproteobacteria bacterium]|nr:hypothetical protein [Deltaproteobacteria bacterium]
MGIGSTAGVLLLHWLAACTCNPDTGSSGPAPEVVEAMQTIEGTVLDADPEILPPITLDGATVPEVDVGDGVQVLQIAPVGQGRRALQAAVIFDRPMVALADLDSMSQSAPLACTPEIPSRRRWAGTSTAVLVPDAGSFPRGTAFRCAVAAGVTALDGVSLEGELSWTFETPRPRVVQSAPSDGASGVDLSEPVLLTFDQPVELSAVEPHLTVRSRGEVVPSTLSRIEGSERGVEAHDRRVLVRFARDPDRTYRLQVSAGVVGKEGPLPSIEAFSTTFTTYPPLFAELDRPEGSTEVSPTAGLSFDFTTPVSQDQVAEHLVIEPKPRGWDPPSGAWESRYWSYGPVLSPRTTYTLRFTAGMKDKHGQTLSNAGSSWSFTTGDYEPWLSVPQGFRLIAANNPQQLPYKHLNAEEVEIRLAAVSRDDFSRPRSWHEAVEAALARGADDREGPGPKRPNLTRLGRTPYASLLQGGAGWIATSFSAPNVRDWEDRIRYFDGLMVVTDMGGTMKVGPSSTEVWVTSLSKGRPLRDVGVEVYKGAEFVGSAKTDHDGLARILGVPRRGWRRWDDEIWALLTRGTERSIVHLGWNDGMSPYNFNIWGGFEASGRRVSSHSYTDRGVYRPGDPVYARATFRFKDADGLKVPSGSVRWVLDDPGGETVAEGSGALDTRGGFSLQTALPAEGELGDYSLRISAEGDEWSEVSYASVMARAYRPPAFRVSVSGPELAVAGSPVEAVVDARYLFGAALQRGQVRWRAWTESRWFHPEGWDGWSFGPEYDWWEEDDGYASPELLGDAVVELEAGRATFSQVVPAEGMDRPVALFLEAEVEDVDRQVIANRAEVLVHPGAFYVGARSKARLPTAGEATEVEVAAVELSGAARAGVPLEVEILRRTWDSVRERGMDGQWRWVTTKSDEVVATESVTSAKEPVSVSFTPKEAGYHVLRVTADDGQGHALVGTDSVYVVGSGYVGWGRSDDNKMELVPDKRTYSPGDRASVLVKSPMQGMSALVTVEREGVLWREVVKLESTASTVEIPIDEAYLPNVFVSVVAVAGAGPQNAPDKGRPEVYMGMVELDVDVQGQHLSVAVRPDNELYRPRDEVSVTVAVKRGGVPVPNAGVTLYAVDEAILSLTDYQTPDPHGTFYAHRPLSVLTADGRVAALDRAPFLTKGASRGGDGGDAGATGPETRSKFLTTIAWQPDLRTGADGTVRATFSLPDNLTTFRIMAVADAGADGFGSGDREIRVSRPLIVRPALPRHLRQGDVAYAGVVVHNDFAQDRTVEVQASVQGPLQLVGSPVSLRVPARSSVEVPFTLEALEVGEARFTFQATAGPDRDAVEWTIPVGRDLLLETTATAGTVEGGKTVTEQIARPDDASTTHGGLSLSASTTALLGAGAGLEYLVDYPHGCVEQKTSRALGSLMALKVRERAGIELPPERLQANVEGVLAELSRFRTPGGGLSYWPGSTYPSVMGTAYALELMGRASEAGFSVDQGLLDGAVRYLRRWNRSKVRRGQELLTLAQKGYVAGALARVGQGDAGLNQILYASRQDLSVFALSGLLQAILQTTGADTRTADLEKILASRTTIEAASASIKENEGSTWARMWGSDDLSTAAALEALLQANPQHPLAPKYALHLASSRRTGHWHNTRATAGALAALARYAELREAPGDAVTASLTLAGQPLISEAVAVPGITGLELGLADVPNGPLVIGSEGGLLYYLARLSYAPKVLSPRDEGFTITRKLQLVDGVGDRKGVSAGALVRVTLTVVTPVVRHDVAVIDRIPAGLEPMDASFATTSQAPRSAPEPGQGTVELPDYGGSWVFDHHEIDDDQVRLYADYMPPGVHTFRYVARATTPGSFDHPPATVEEMYEPENFGRTGGGRFTVGAAAVAGR